MFVLFYSILLREDTTKTVCHVASVAIHSSHSLCPFRIKMPHYVLAIPLFTIKPILGNKVSTVSPNSMQSHPWRPYLVTVYGGTKVFANKFGRSSLSLFKKNYIFWFVFWYEEEEGTPESSPFPVHRAKAERGQRYQPANLAVSAVLHFQIELWDIKRPRCGILQ